MEGHGDVAMRDGLDGFYWFSVPALAWLFRCRISTVEVLAAAGKLGARRVEDDIDYFQIYMAEQYFDRFVPIAERKAVCRQIKWMSDVLQNWRQH